MGEALAKAGSLIGEGSIGIQNPDGSWVKLDEEWERLPKIAVIRMKKNGLNPKQAYLLEKWKDQFLPSEIKFLQTGGHTAQELWHFVRDIAYREHLDIEDLFFESITWCLLETIEVLTGNGLTDWFLDRWAERKRGQR